MKEMESFLGVPGLMTYSSKLDFLVRCRLIDLAQHIVVDHFESIALNEVGIVRVSG